MVAKFCLNIANLYSKVSTPIYLPVFTDFRGRFYPNCSFLSYQGNELNANLIEFYQGEILSTEGVRYFFIHGANCYGLDKLPFDVRYRWV